MPIRFRCKYCNQLLGIARRKAGTNVQCPTCHGKLAVPESGPAVQGGHARPLFPAFERGDFDDVLARPFSEKAARHVSASAGRRGGDATAPVPPRAPIDAASLDVEVAPEEAPSGVIMPRGIFLTPKRIFLLILLVNLLVALAFAAGLLVERFVLSPSAS